MRKEYENPEVKVCYFGVREEVTASLSMPTTEELDKWT